MRSPGLFFLVLLLSACSANERALPILGAPKLVAGKKTYPKIKPFRFTNQDSLTITDNNFDGKVYVADFMFLSCPSICPKMTQEMKKVYARYKEDDRVLFLSHTIDPFHDTVAALKRYASKLNVDSKKWHFVTGDKDAIYSIAINSYFSAAYADQKAPGGYVHSGGLLLIDTNKHIRGVYDGTNREETNRLIDDLAILLK